MRVKSDRLPSIRLNGSACNERNLPPPVKPTPCTLHFLDYIPERRRSGGNQTKSKWGREVGHRVHEAGYVVCLFLLRRTEAVHECPACTVSSSDRRGGSQAVRSQWDCSRGIAAVGIAAQQVGQQTRKNDRQNANPAEFVGAPVRAYPLTGSCAVTGRAQICTFEG